MSDLQAKRSPELFKNEIRRVISRISRVDEADLQDHVLIREELGIDSLTGMEIIYSCEKHLGIKVDETLFVDVQTVNDFLVLLVEISGGKCAERSPDALRT